MVVTLGSFKKVLFIPYTHCFLKAIAQFASFDFQYQIQYFSDVKKYLKDNFNNHTYVYCLLKSLFIE